jgi:hypothetical protein
MMAFNSWCFKRSLRPDEVLEYIGMPPGQPDQAAQAYKKKEDNYVYRPGNGRILSVNKVIIFLLLSSPPNRYDYQNSQNGHADNQTYSYDFKKDLHPRRSMFLNPFQLQEGPVSRGKANRG